MDPITMSRLGMGYFSDDYSAKYNAAFDESLVGENLAQSTNLYANNYNYMSNPMMGGMMSPMMGGIDTFSYANPSFSGAMNPMMGGMMNPMMGGITPAEYQKLMKMDSEQKMDYMMQLQEKRQEKMFGMTERQQELSNRYQTRTDELRYNYAKSQEQLQRGRAAEQQRLVESAENLHRKIMDNRKDEVMKAYHDLVTKVKTSPEYAQRVQLGNGKYKTEPLTDEQANDQARKLYASQFGDLARNIYNELSNSDEQGFKRLVGFGFADRENADSLIAKIYHNGQQNNMQRIVGLQWQD